MHFSTLLPFAALAGTLAAQTTFAPALQLNVGTRPDGMAIGDVDGDGDLDFAVAIDAPVNGVRLFLNDGTGAFSQGASITISSQTRSIVLADLDRDGDLDLAAAAGSPAAVFVRLNDGGGTFVAGGSFPIGPNSRGMSVADLDRDGDLDLAVASRDADAVTVLRNAGNATFAATTWAVGAEPRNVVIADLDRDGLPDLATSNHDSRNLSVLRNLGNGSFAPHVTYAVNPSWRPEWVTAADVDGDGDLELIAAIGENPGRVGVFANNGNGTFAAASYTPTGADPGSVIAVDVDGDRDLDLVTSNETGNDATVLQNGGNGSFTIMASLPTGLFAESVVATDADRDGDMDLLVANRDANTVSVLINTGAAAATAPVIRIGGSTAIGQTMVVQMTSPLEPAMLYVLMMSHAASPALILPDNRSLNLAPSPFLSAPLTSGIFSDAAGVLDGTGNGYARVAIPAVPAIRGLSFWFGFGVIDPNRSLDIGGISDARQVTLQ